MTQGEDAAPRQPQQIQGGGNTFAELTISKFGGMNTVSPKGAFGQPTLLENIVLDRLGGYASSPSPRDVITFADNITKVEPFDGINTVFVKTTTSVYLVNLVTGALLNTITDLKPSVAPYQRGAVITWDTTHPLDGIVAYTLKDDGTLIQTNLLDKPALTFTFVENTNFFEQGGTSGTIMALELGTDPLEPHEPPEPTDPGGGTGGSIPGVTRLYPAGTYYGFDPRTTHYLMLYPRPWLYTTKPKPGSTLNPQTTTPDKIRPIILRLPAFPGGLTNEYMVKFANPSNTDYEIYGASLPSQRPYPEYTGEAVDHFTLHPSKNVDIGTLMFASPKTDGGVTTQNVKFAGLTMMYQALNTGITAATEPNWPDTLGSTVADGSVTWLNRGIYYSSGRNLSFSEYIARVGNAPVDYLPPELEWKPLSDYLGTWAQLHTEGNPDGDVTIFRSADPTPTTFAPHSFFPVGTITELHLGRTWVMADATWRTYAVEDVVGTGYVVRGADGGAAVDIETPSWELAKQRRTVYYSEPDTPWQFLERFIVLPLSKSKSIVAMRSVGDYLMFFGEADAVVVAGDSEANFYTRSLDIPGAFSQATTAVYQGTLYYRGVGGIYRINGGRAEKISAPINNLIPDVPEITESMGVDYDDGRLMVRVNSAYTLCYDFAADGWTIFTANGDSLQAGVTGYLAYGHTIRALDAAPNDDGKIIYAGIDGGQARLRKGLKSVAFVVESDNPDNIVELKTQAHRPNAAPSGYSIPFTRLVDQTEMLLSFRTPDRFGYSFDIEIDLYPNSAFLVVRPGISIELYGDGIIRKGM